MKLVSSTRDAGFGRFFPSTVMTLMTQVRRILRLAGVPVRMYDYFVFIMIDNRCKAGNGMCLISTNVSVSWNPSFVLGAVSGQ